MQPWPQQKSSKNTKSSRKQIVDHNRYDAYIICALSLTMYQRYSNLQHNYYRIHLCHFQCPLCSFPQNVHRHTSSTALPSMVERASTELELGQGPVKSMYVPRLWSAPGRGQRGSPDRETPPTPSIEQVVNSLLPRQPNKEHRSLWILSISLEGTDSGYLPLVQRSLPRSLQHNR